MTELEWLNAQKEAFRLLKENYKTISLRRITPPQNVADLERFWNDVETVADHADDERRAAQGK